MRMQKVFRYVDGKLRYQLKRLLAFNLEYYSWV